jgi:hypothetical protein
MAKGLVALLLLMSWLFHVFESFIHFHDDGFLLSADVNLLEKLAMNLSKFLLEKRYLFMTRAIGASLVT